MYPDRKSLESDPPNNFNGDYKPTPVFDSKAPLLKDTANSSTASLSPMPNSPTPLPKMKAFIICLIVFCEAYVSCSIFAYIGFMVLDWKIVKDEADVGYYSGFVASAFFACQFLSSYAWGILADRIGRRPVLIIGMIGSLISNILFGFSKTLWWAISTRCISGLLNGNVGTARTYMGDISDKSNRARAFSLIGLTWSIGNILGPISGGFLSQPTFKYDWFPDDFAGGVFHTYPFLLPNIVASAVTLIALILGIFYATETRPRNAYRTVRSQGDPAESQPIINPSFRRLVVETEKRPSATDIFKDKTAMTICVVCALHSFCQIIFTECFPLWALIRPSSGGLDFDSNDVGLVQSFGGVYGILTQLFVYHHVADCIGVSKLCRITVFGMVIMVFITPFANQILVNSTTQGFNAGFWVYIIACVAIYFQMSTVSFTAITTMIANSVSFDKMGAINGFAQTLTSLLRAGAPTLGANLLAWSTSANVNWLYSFRFIFVFTSFVYLVNMIVCFFLPARLDRPFGYGQKTRSFEDRS